MNTTDGGTQNDDNVNSGQVLNREAGGGSPPEKIPNYLVQSILVTLFCCLPFGVAAIVFAAQVNSKLQGGDIAGARESSRKAKMWCWWSFGIGFAVQAVYLVFYVVAMMSAEASYM